jgi:hypothetical protein
MEGDRSTIERPWWVKLGLWGISGRRMAWTFVWLGIALGVACVVYGIWNRWFSAGAIWFVAALWDLLAIRWVDEHGAWP